MKKKLPDDPRFENVSYHSTDLRKTFARVRARIAAAKAKEVAVATRAVIPFGKIKQP
ncbi:MAG TPA: hypothetical protein VF077_01025 [Nitrospiraceae bacterium]